MQIGIISDTHSSYRAVEKALGILSLRRIDTVLHCGDIEDAATVLLFRPFTTHFVFGNCDGDREGLRHAMAAAGATLHETFGSLEIQGKKLAWLHGDNQRLFRDVSGSGHYDYLFYGHTHVAEQHVEGPTRVVNPGALYRARMKTFVILDLATNELESVAVE